MGLGFDLNAMKLEAAKASTDEKQALLMYMKKYEDLLRAGYKFTDYCVERDLLFDSMINNPVISPQTFVAFCVWAFT